jgi:DNA-binding transcriptional MerR regulator
VETYVLRFWETQFPQLKPNKSGTGQRLYRRRDVELALEIKRLVHAEGYTISGARTVLEKGQHKQGARQSPQTDLPLTGGPSSKMDAVAATVGHARAELREIAGMLASPLPQPPRRRSRLASIASASAKLFET